MDGNRQVLVVHEGAQLERDLLDCAALFASLDPATRMRVAAMPREGVPLSLATAARTVCAARGVTDVTVQLLTEPEQDAVFDAARRAGADLLVVRHPGRRDDGPELLRRFLVESPCAVCFVPRTSAVRLRRVVAAIDLGPSSHRVMAAANRLCARARVEELIAFHGLEARESLPDADEGGGERRREEAVLALYRCRSQAPPAASRFTPVVAVGAPWDRALLKTAAAHGGADLVIVGGGPPVAPRPWRRRTLEYLSGECDVPLLVLAAPPPHASEQRLLRRILSESEPAFN